MFWSSKGYSGSETFLKSEFFCGETFRPGLFTDEEMRVLG